MPDANFTLFKVDFGLVGIGVGIVLGLFLIAAINNILHGNKKEKSPKRENSFRQLQSIVLEEIKNVRELATFRKNFKSTIFFTEASQLPFFNARIPGTTRKFSMDYVGTIVCGCDLNEIHITQDGNSNRVKITVPQIKILDIYADVNSFMINHQKSGIFAPNIKIEEQNEWIAQDLKSQEQAAIDEGILERSDENIRQVLNSIIESKGLNENFEVEIVFLKAGEKHSLTLPNSQKLLR